MKIPTLLTLALTVTACGDNLDNDRPDGGGGDASTPDAATRPERAIVVAGDFNAGNPGTLVAIDIDARAVLPLTAPAGAIGEDPIVRYEAGELFIVNRNAGNNVTILDANTLALVEQLGTGANSNPQDVAVVGDKLIVATLGNKGAVVLTRGSNTVEELDLSADDPDDKPNCSSIYKVGDRLYVACGLLDDTMQFLPPRGPAKVYILDATTFAQVDALTLSTKNPISLFEQLPEYAPNAGDLLLPTVEFATGMGCVERISTGATPAAAGCVVANTDLGNYASRVGAHAVEFTGPVRSNVVVPPMLYMTVATPDFSGSALRAFDLGTSMLQQGQTAATQVLGDLAVCPTTGTLVVADTKMGAHGVRLYQGTSELTTQPLPISLRPVSSHGAICF